MAHTLNTTPKQDGFYVPGAWQHKKQCWMIWPEQGDVWPYGARKAQLAYVRVASTIVEYEPVTMCVSANQFSNARGQLPASVRLIEMSSNDAWMRDSGPNFIINGDGEVRGIDWGFNSWGGHLGALRTHWELDEQIAQKVLESENTDRYKAPIVAEGGALQCDGEGTLITTRQCLLNPNRKGELSDEAVDQALKDYMNLEKIIWLPQGCPFDETDGHIDDLCVFAAPGVVLLTWTDDLSDPQYDVSQLTYDILSNETDAKGRSLQIIKVHQPDPIGWTAEEHALFDQNGEAYKRTVDERIAATYINYYIANEAVVVPLYEDRHDEAALKSIQQAFPTRKVIGVAGCRDILLGGGSIGCITQPQYSGKKIEL
jgi:agmatine deiminase